jgi:hypothetical protein
MNCSKGEKGAVFGLRYYDSKKDQRKVQSGGTYPVDVAEVLTPKPGTHNMIYDYGYRQKDGSYIDANHAALGMKVKVSPNRTSFERKEFKGFNTYLYCVRCSPCKR